MTKKMVGTIWDIAARLYDAKGTLIAHCIDTPNGIANAFLECPQAQKVHTLMGYKTRKEYASRMYSWNTAASRLELVS